MTDLARTNFPSSRARIVMRLRDTTALADCTTVELPGNGDGYIETVRPYDWLSSAEKVLFDAVADIVHGDALNWPVLSARLDEVNVAALRRAESARGAACVAPDRSGRRPSGPSGRTDWRC